MIRKAGVLILAGVFTVTGCSDEGADPVAPAPPEGVSFSAQVKPIFNAICSGCHGLNGNGGLDLREGQAFGNLVGVESQGYPGHRVVPGDPDSSVLHRKLNGLSGVDDQMPLGGPPLPEASLNLIRDWIFEGAKDN